MTSESQKRASAKWDSANVKSVLVKLYPKDADLLAWMDRHGYRGAWLAGLARREFERERNRGETRGTFRVAREARRLWLEGGFRVRDSASPGATETVAVCDTLEGAIAYADRMAVADGGVRVVDGVYAGAVEHAVFVVADEGGATVYERDALDARPDVRLAWREAVMSHYMRHGGGDVDRKTVVEALAELRRVDASLPRGV